jgi:hypothetical protein
VIWAGGEVEYFCWQGWTGQISLNCFNKFPDARSNRSPHERSDMRVMRRRPPRMSPRYPGYSHFAIAPDGPNPSAADRT